jgi:ABC-type multidrug transport system fused ATPase/permease subunit
MSRRRNQEDRPKVKLTRERLQKALQIFTYVLPYKWYMVAGLFFLIMGSLLFLAIMKLPGEILNIAGGKAEWGLSLNKIFTILIGLLLLQSIFSYFRVQVFAIISEKSIAALRKDLYSKLITLPIVFLEERRVGELTSRITSDVGKIQQVVSVTLAEFLRQIILLVGGVGIIMFTMSRLALVMLATFPLAVLVAVYMGRRLRRLMRARQDQLAQTNIVVEETMQSIHTVKAYTNESFELRRYLTHLDEVVRASLKAANIRGFFASFIIFVMLGTLFLIMWRAAILVQRGEMVEGNLIDFIAYAGIIGGAIASIGNFYAEIVAAIGSTERVFDILQEEPEIDLDKVDQSLPAENRLQGHIVYQDVHFSYPTRSDVPVLKGINLEVQPGKKVALVGASGAGKSTIVQLLLRYYTPQQGRILVDGKDIETFDISSYRKNLAIVPQEVILFGGTIRENIRYGKPDATDEEIRLAAEKANALDFIQSFPEAFETTVGERGVKLSGGQRQRIAIARAILNDPVILLLDEATSALDAESEKAVQDALNTLMEGRTSIIIAHRLATIRDVDCIYVIEDGTIVESGTHAALSDKENGAYSTLARLQFDLTE